MRLTSGLGVGKGDVIALVGAGGKTTLMFRLAQELTDGGWRVITTTTTKIRPPHPGQTQQLIVESDAMLGLRKVTEALKHRRHVTLASRRLDGEDKLEGIPSQWVPGLKLVADTVLIEADGAKGHSLKAPAIYEPVIPSATTMLLPVVGMDVVGLSLCAGSVHRPELVARVTELALGDPITPGAVGRLITHQQGGLKGLPEGCRVLPVLNKVEDDLSLENARTIAVSVKAHADVDRVLITSATAKDPVVECWRRVSAVVLAAGEASRFGSLKQLAPMDGKTMIEHVIARLMGSWVDEIIVVVGCRGDQVAQYVPSGCRIVVNQDWRDGMSSSIRWGLRAIDSRSEAALFVLADQPAVDAGTINQLLLAYYRTDKSIVVPMFGNQRGNPVLFDRRHFTELQGLQGDVGGRCLIARLSSEVEAVQTRSPAVLIDIDTEDDYARYRTSNERNQ